MWGTGPYLLSVPLATARSKHLLQLTPTKGNNTNLFHPTQWHLEKWFFFFQRHGIYKELRLNHASVVNTYINNLHELEKEPVAHENMAAWVSGQKVSITDDCG